MRVMWGKGGFKSFILYIESLKLAYKLDFDSK